MSKSIIRLLIAGDSADEAESLSNALRQGGYLLKTLRIEDIGSLDAALGKEAWDAVLYKSALPQLKITDVRQVLDKHQAACALLLITKKMAADEIRQGQAVGVRDVFVQGDWVRLGPALEREIETARAQLAQAETAETLRQLENRYRVMIETSQEAVAYCHEGVYVDANPAYLSLVGCADVDDLRTIPVLNLIDKNDHARFKSWLRKPNSHEGAQEYLALDSDGRSFAAEIAMSPIHLGGESCVQIFVRDVSKRKALEVKLQYLHQRDALTGIFNRPYFMQELTRSIEHAEKNKSCTRLVGVEILGLKDLNQSIGHSTCDRMLMSITRCLRELTDKNHLLARTGGGQFSILLGGQNENENKKFIENIRANTAKAQFKEAGNDIALNIVVKDVAIDGGVADREKLLNQVFAADTQGKAPVRAGKEPVAEGVPVSAAHSPSPAMTSETASLSGAGKPATMTDFSDLISAALANNSIEVLFQPIVNLHGEPRELFEVLPAIQMQNGEILGADKFMPSAIKSGQASKIDRWMMQQCIEHLTQRKKANQETSLFVSLSESVLTDKILLQAALQHLKATGLDAGRIYLQLSAATVKKQNAAARSFVAEARKIGLNVVINSLDSQRIGIDDLQGIDIAFIAIDCCCDTEKGECTMNDNTLRNAVALAKKLETATIARRVENAEVFSLLWGAGVDYIQGDYLSPALTSPDHHFAEEQTLSSDVTQPAFNLRAAG